MVSAKYDKLTTFCNDTYKDFDEMINNFNTEIDSKYNEKVSMK